MIKEFYTTSEFAKLLSIHPRSVVRLIKAKKIRCVNVGLGKKPCYRILCKEYLRFIAEQYTKQDEGEI